MEALRRRHRGNGATPEPGGDKSLLGPASAAAGGLDPFDDGCAGAGVSNIFDEDQRRFEEIFQGANASEIREFQSSEESSESEQPEIPYSSYSPLEPREEEEFCELRTPGPSLVEDRRRLSEELEAELRDEDQLGMNRVFYAPERAPPLFDFITIMSSFLVAVFAAYYTINL